ncbi:MAG: hypothetical protein AMXMBFR33_04020 [Candidatus Xenobia bacterium]|jgi:hypothetical protein
MFQGMSQHAPNCHQCQYFKVSWDSRFPKSCSKFGFKGRQLPSIEVLATTGQQCIFFIPKPEAVPARPAYQPLNVLPSHCTISVVG